MKGFAKFLADLPWVLLLVLVIFFDGAIGGIIRFGLGKKTLSKVVGLILFVSFVLSLLSVGLNLDPILQVVFGLLYFVCWLADVITVILKKKIVLFAD